MPPKAEPRGDDPCPSRIEWSGFLLGEISSDRQNVFSHHLESCRDCLALVDTIDDIDDGLAAALRNADAADPLLDDPAYLRFQSRALALGQGERAEDEAERFRDGPGKEWGRYILREVVGSGGYGIVWRAFDTELRREVALKLPRGHDMLDAETRARFIHEARAAACLSHPNILPILDAGSLGDVPYIAMEFCPGPNLAEWQRERIDPVPPRGAARLTASLADAVAEAHRAGVLHRDIKPTNVLLFPLQEGNGASRDELAIRPKLADFGAAKLWLDATLRQDAMRTRSGGMVGTPDYMAPEQAAGQGRDPDPRADVWSLGALLYQLLTGRPPFRGETAIETLKLAAEQEPAAPRLLRPGLPRDLETIILKCLAKHPRDRYESSRLLSDDLNRWLEGRPILARPISPPGRFWRFCRRRPAVTSLTAAFLCSMTLGLATATVFWSRAEAARRQALGYFEITSRHLDELVQSASLPPASWDRSVRDTLTRSATTYRELLRRRPKDRQVRHTLARIDHQLALREMRRYRPGDCLPLLEEASRLADGLLAEDPADQELQVWASEVRIDLGIALWEREDLHRAIRVHEETCRMLEPLLRASSESRARVAFARARRHLGLALVEQEDLTEGLRMMEESGVELGRWLERNPSDVASIRSLYLLHFSAEGSSRVLRVAHQLPQSVNDLGLRIQLAWSLAGRMYNALLPEEALGFARQQVDFLEPAIGALSQAASRVEDPGFLWFTSRLEENLAMAYVQLGRLADAQPLSERALRHSLEWILQNENEAGDARWLIDTSVRHVQLMMNRTDDPIELEEAVAYLRGVYLGISVRSGRPETWLANLAHAIALLGGFRRIDAGRLDQSNELIRQASLILDPLSGELSGDPGYQLAVSELWTQIAKNRARGPDRQATYEALLHAAEAARAAFRLEPRDSDGRHRSVVDNRLARLARFYAEEKRFPEAETMLEQCAELWDGEPEGLKDCARRFRELTETITRSSNPPTEAHRQCHERCIVRADALEKRAAH